MLRAITALLLPCGLAMHTYLMKPWPKETTMDASTDLSVRARRKNRLRDAPRNPDFTIDQDWASYSAAEHDRWDRLFRRSLAALQNRACDEFTAMMKALSLSDGGIPDMEKLSDRLESVTGWRVV